MEHEATANPETPREVYKISWPWISPSPLESQRIQEKCSIMGLGRLTAPLQPPTPH